MISFTEKAGQKLKAIQEEQNKQGQVFRIKAVGGGCSGYSYGMDFEEAQKENDHVFESQGVTIVVDPKSLPLIDECVIDWSDALTGAGFTVTNPNATGSCGCGQSFTV